MLLYLSHSLILSSSCTVHSFEHLSRSILPCRANRRCRVSLSFCRVRTFIHLLSVLPAARVLSTRCFSSLSILPATLLLSFSCATVLPLFLLRSCLAILLLVLVRSLSRATSHVAPTHSCFPTNDTHPHDRYQ